MRATEVSVDDNRYLRFGKIPEDHWSYPAHVDKQKALKMMKQLKREGVPYGALESYHHMCRYQSGFFYKHELLKDVDWYWRVRHCEG